MLVLIGAGIVTAGLGEWIDSSVIFGVVVVNAIIGYLQEGKAEAALAALARAVATDVTVVRGGRRRRMDAVHLVPGDVVWLSAGDKVPADLRIVSGRQLRTVEAATDRRGGTGRQASRAAAAGHPARRPPQHGLCRHVRGRRPGQRPGRRHGRRHRNRTHLGPDRRRAGNRHAADEKDGRIRRPAAVGDPRPRRAHLRRRRAARRILERHADGRRGTRRRRHPRRPAGGNEHHPGHRRRPHGQAPRHHPPPAGGGSAGQHDGDLLGQDRHADRKRHDRHRAVGRRRSLHGRRPGLHAGRQAEHSRTRTRVARSSDRRRPVQRLRALPREATMADHRRPDRGGAAGGGAQGRAGRNHAAHAVPAR